MILPILYSILSQFFFVPAQVPLNIKEQKINVIAYYAGNEKEIDQFEIEKLTHIIYSFGHLKGNKIDLADKQIPVITKLVSLKKRNPGLKVMVALGGWSGCETCSDAFSSAGGREEFAQSVRKLISDLKIDGIDLDWEYPAIQGPPDHKFKAEDKQNFTELVIALRKAIGKNKEISFAAGGFPEFLEKSIEWNKVMPLIDRVNLMTYDLVNGNSDTTGHQTSLYPTTGQSLSADKAIEYLKGLNVPVNKMVIGMAFYARIFKLTNPTDSPLYKPAKFQTF